MTNHLLLLACAYLALTNTAGSFASSSSEWESFKSKHGKSYGSNIEDSMRSKIFAFNKRQIAEFCSKQSDNSSFKLGLNHLADLSELEMKARNGFKLSRDHHERLRNIAKTNKFLENILSDASIDVPVQVDWRKVPGRVTDVKDQGDERNFELITGDCGSCWAFSTTGVLEGQEMVRTSNVSRFNLIKLSEQNLLDCDNTNFCCLGGHMESALEYIKSAGGIDDDKSYPYKAYSSGICQFNVSNVAMTDAGAVVLPANDEQMLKKVVAKFGPVAVAIDASNKSFRFYHSGVYYEKNCKTEVDDLDHAVLVVGYGTDPKGGDFWIVKNSWSPIYGESGYIRMARNRGNNCGIATSPIIPTF